APPIERYREIEVVKGSGSILFGPQTIGGVINFLTIAPPSDRRVSVEADGGSYGYAKALASYGDGFQGVRYVVQAFHKQANGARDEPWQADDVFAKVAFDTSPRGQVTVKVGFHDERAVSTEVGETLAMYRSNAQRPTFTPDDFLHVHKYEVSVVQEHQFSPETKLRTLAYAYETARVWRRQDFDRYPLPGTLYDRIVGDPGIPEGAIYFKPTDGIVDRTYDVAGIEPKLEQKFTTSWVEHDLEAGARFLVENGHRQQREGSNPDTFAGELQIDETHRTYAVAGYALDNIAFGDRVHVSPGVRVEHAQYERDVDRDLVLGVPTDEAVRGATYDTAVIPGVGMVLGPADAHVFGGVHVGYAPPRIVTAISNTGVDAQLAPEKSIEYEVGARVHRPSWLRAEATGFLTNFENQIIVGNALTGAETNLINGGSTRHVGVEGGVVVGVGKALGLPLTVDVGANATFARATFVGGQWAGNLLPYAPEAVVSARLDVEHESGLGAELAVAYTGRQFTDELDTVPVDPTGQDGAIDPYVIVDLSARYKNAATGLSVNLAVKNLTNATYVLSRQPQGIFPGEPLTVIGGVRWDYAK
ncbi:MAG TPA: TonB-dependent receptor, partial [Minicystis sp.]|nr:TonB-dependent receptor [Minicystis sp.]